jgi:hypothetical protein
MGRPPIGKHAMTGAQRQQRYMAKLLAGAKPSVTKPGKADSADLVRVQRQEFGETGKLRGEIGKLKSDIAKLKAMLQEEPDAARLRKKVIDQQIEMASLRAAMKRIAKERDEHQARVNRYQKPKYREARHLLTRKNHDLLIKALHSDRMKQCTADELKEAAQLVVALRPVFDE